MTAVVRTHGGNFDDNGTQSPVSIDRFGALYRISTEDVELLGDHNIRYAGNSFTSPAKD